MLTRSLRADLGVMISASHNPYQDNGIKLFGPDGHKLSDAVEREIEDHVDNGVAAHLAAPASLGRATRLDDAQGRYTEFVKQTFPRGLTLEGLKVVVDCANGAAYKVAPEVPVGAGCRGGPDRRRSRRLQHQQGLRLHRVRDHAEPSGGPRRPSRRRLRRRCRPGGHRRRGRGADRRRSDHGSDRQPVVGRRPAQGRRRGRHGDVEFRPGRYLDGLG